MPRSALPPLPERLLSRVTGGMLWLALVMLLGLTALVILQVLARNLLDLGLPWADELSRWFGIALVFLAVPRLLLEERHIAMDLVPAMLPRAGQWALATLGRLALIGFAGVMLWALYRFLLRAGRFGTPALGIPNTLFYLPLVLGFALVALIAAWRLVHAPARDAAREAEDETLPEPDA
ncbi:TRAP transporter small permease [Acidimangrovimonas sediminis]|uniref:TRAP transporter small permease n=1 Tax=Acidimangrovimonas sediminis TaxID=2056283 RepID=UPI000C7FE8E8|nr:TRAP transporter small permease [Acidimangrovimonas sediminis]